MGSGDTSVDVCIVGYGPTGATLANLLGQASVSALVVERQAAPYDLPRAVAFDAEVMRIFQAIGLAQRILPITKISLGTRFIDGFGRLLLEWPRAQTVGPQGWHAGYRFHQPELEAILRQGVDRFPQVQVRALREFLDAEQDAGGVLVRLRNLSTGAVETVRCRYLVGADGAKSPVRETMIGTDWHDLNFTQNWLVVDLHLKRPMPELGEYSIQFCEPERPATYVCGTGMRRRWEIALLPHEDPDEMTRPDHVWSRLGRWLTPLDADMVRCASYTFRAAINRRWRNRRCLIAGDAAHLTPPFLGQGMCAGIRDAGNLAWKLVRVLRGLSGSALLDTYASERIPHVTAYVARAVRLGEVINTAALENVTDGEPIRSGGLRIQSIAPLLGPGFSAGWDAPAGRVAPQPMLSDGRRADDVAGCGFALFALPDLDVRARDGLAVIDDPAVRPWLEELGVQAVMVRPDRYVLGAARNRDELDDLLAVV